VHEFSHLRARKNGAVALVDMHIVVDPMLTVSAAHVLAELVRHRVVSNVKEVADVTIHVDPEQDEDEFTQEELFRALGERRAGAIPDTRSDPIDIEKTVREAIMDLVDGVTSVTHVRVNVFKSGVTTECTIEVDPDAQVREASVIARRTREVVEALDHVRAADIHLELDDWHDDGAMQPTQKAPRNRRVHPP